MRFSPGNSGAFGFYCREAVFRSKPNLVIYHDPDWFLSAKTAVQQGCFVQISAHNFSPAIHGVPEAFKKKRENTSSQQKKT